MLSMMMLALIGAAAPVAETATTPTVRELVCRGKAHLQLTTRHDPSPRNPAAVALTLQYQRSESIGGDYSRLEAGRCTWNPYGWDNIPPEPGVVEFDVPRDGGLTVPTPRSLAVYLGNPDHYWVFYVDDSTNVALSNGPWRGTFWAGEEDLATANRTAGAASLRREQLRCRGGAGLVFQRGATVAANQVTMTLGYTAAGAEAGPDGRSLAPGTCAWADREAARAEPGRIVFLTAGNAQLRQIQSGSTVDRSVTAAERFPDANTIPQYMALAHHYWEFTVSLRDPDSALGHAAWKRPVDGGFAADRPATTQVQQVFDIRNVQVTPGLDGAVIRFEAAAGVKPTVAVNVAAPTGSAPSLAFSESVPLTVSASGTASAGMMRYTAASNTPLARGTRYWYVITAPEGAQARLNQATGDFRTLAQHFTLGVTEIRIISDGDADSNGDLYFDALACPRISLRGTVQGTSSAPVDWTEGRYPLSVELVTNVGTDPGEGQIRSVPDRFRIVLLGVDDDTDVGLDGPRPSHPTREYRCPGNPDIQPGSNSMYEWNSIAMDFDLTQHPGTSATGTFHRRSKPLRNASRLAFEVRGYFKVERR